MEEMKKVCGKPVEPMQGVVEVSPDNGEGFQFTLVVEHVVDRQTGKAMFYVRDGNRQHLVDEVVVGNVTYRAVNYEVAYQSS